MDLDLLGAQWPPWPLPVKAVAGADMLWCR
jgi:hypothetical protein